MPSSEDLNRQLLDLEYGWVNLAPSGFLKQSVPISTDVPSAINYPVLQRLSAQPRKNGKNSVNDLTANSLSAFRTTSFCSGIGKKRHDNCCCEQSKNQPEHIDNRGTSCFTNQKVDHFLASTRNLYRRDANGKLHKTYMVLSFFTGQINHLISETAQEIGRKEGSLKITPEKISALRPDQIEIGIFHPNGSDQMSLELDRSKRIAALSHNDYITQSSLFQAESRLISNDNHFMAHPMPTSSQLWAISRYVYRKINQGAWPDITTSGIQESMKIYDPMYRWRHSPLPDETRTLPSMFSLCAHIAGNSIPANEFYGCSESAQRNRTLLDQITRKIQYETQNSLFIPIANHHMAQYFQRSEFHHGSLDSILRNTARYRLHRALPAVNSLVEIEFGLRPNEYTLCEYRKHHSILEEPGVR